GGDALEVGRPRVLLADHVELEVRDDDEAALAGHGREPARRALDGLDQVRRAAPLVRERGARARAVRLGPVPPPEGAPVVGRDVEPLDERRLGALGAGAPRRGARIEDERRPVGPGARRDGEDEEERSEPHRSTSTETGTGVAARTPLPSKASASWP